MELHPLFGKKKKKFGPAPNPLFCQWLQEWRDEAVEKGRKSQYIYGKALYALKKYPIPMSAGKECKMLDNFGDKICKMLDDKLARHIELHGSADAASHILSVASTSTSQVRNQRKKQTKKRRPSSAQSTCTSLSSESAGENETGVPQQKRKPKSSGQGRDYIPAVGSGAYALLVTLYSNMQHPDSQDFMTKNDLTREAQPLAEKSFTIIDPGCRYTAWSSMGTLVKKHLVIKDSCPAKYSLTDAGCEIAHKLQIVENGSAIVNGTMGPSRVPALPDVAAPSLPQRMESGSEDEPEILIPQKAPLFGLPARSFNYHYVKEDDTLVTMKDQAAVIIDDEISIGFLISCRYTDLLESGKRYKLDTSRPLGEHVYAYLHNDDADDLANPSHHNQAKQYNTSTFTNLQTKTTLSSDLQSGVLTTVPSQRHHSPAVDKEFKPGPDQQQEKDKSDLTNPKRRKKVDKDQTSALPFTFDVPSFSASSFHPTPAHLHSGDSRDSSQNSVNSVSSTSSIRSLSSVSSVQSLSTPDFVLYPSTFEIVLCVDNCEFYGSSKSDGKTLLPDLIKNGVDTDLRKLQVGDLLWIAREKMAAIPGQLARPKGRELVLDYIIERKRMDDLVHSCIDGRLQEQKFRLKHCGLRHPIYLVEDYGSAQHFSISEDKIKQSITNTQVIDGFQVKRTKDTKETVAYLTVMTRYLQSLYNGKTLYACSSEEIQAFNEIKSVDDSEVKLMTFLHFNQASVKNKDLTATELFGKQLIQLYGMSAERAKAIVEVYPTLSHLISNYDSCSTEKEKENLLSNIKSGKSVRFKPCFTVTISEFGDRISFAYPASCKRNLGAAQSKMIYHLYCTTGPLC